MEPLLCASRNTTGIVVFYWRGVNPVKKGRIYISLILRLGRVDLVDPVQDPALEVLDPLEPDRLQEFHRFRAATAHLAVRDDVLVLGQLGITARQLAERNQDGPWNLADLVFVGLPHIEDEHVVA